MSISWSSVGSIFGGLTTALSNAGVAAANIPSTLSQIFAVSNPDQSAELQICSSILVAANNPTLVGALAMKLETEQGIPAAALAVATQLTAPGVDIAAKVLEIEQIIKAGG